MNINIFLNFENDKVTFSVSIPFDFIDINEEEYHKLDDKTFYTCENGKLDYNIFNRKIESIKNIIKNSFSINEEINTTLAIISSENNKPSFDFIKNNKDLEIIYDIEDFKEIIDNLKDDNYPNLKIIFKNSDNIITYKEFYDMYKKLNEIVDFINHYNLSPLEKVMLVYDIVKANEYKKENKNENYGISRNLNEIIKNDKIVCVGYANLIDFLLKNLGIKSNTILLEYENKNVGHERNYIYLKDDKYDIDGVFFLDATWDSKKNDNYLDNYACFLKPLHFFKRLRPQEHVVTPNKFKLLEKSKEELIKYMNNVKDMELVRFSITLSQLVSEYKPGFGTVLGMGEDSNEKLTNMISEIMEKYCKRIKESAFKNALYRVRKIEFINGILKKEITEEYIDEVCTKYYSDNAEIKLLKALNMYDKPTLSKDLKYSKAKTTKEDILRMRLLRAIKEKINDKPDNDYIRKM